MAKRFIDTQMFNDEWFCELSPDCKLFFIYFISTCNHAGVFKYNKKLCEFQTGLKSSERLIEELGNSLVTVKEGLYFMPRFIKFQYPNFPKSTVAQQVSAIKILQDLGFWDFKNNTYRTVTEELVKYYDNDSVIVKNKKEEILNSQSWIENICIKKKIDKYFCLKLLNTFLDAESLKSDWDIKSIADTKDHFINWVQIQITKKVEPNTTGRNLSGIDPN